MQYFNIQVASELSGVTSATIRTWEKRYNAVIPDRATNGHRLYSVEDIEKLAVLARLTEVGQNIGKIAHLSLAILKEVYSNLLQKPYIEVRFPISTNDLEISSCLKNCLIAVAAKKFHIIGHELEKALASYSPKDLCRQFIIPFVEEIHDQVSKNVLLITHEDIIKNLIHFFLGKIIWTQSEELNDHEKVMIFYNKRHDVKALILGIFLIGAQKTPYFINNLDGPEGSQELIDDIAPSSIYIFPDFQLSSQVQNLNIKQILLPSAPDLFLYFLDEI